MSWTSALMLFVALYIAALLARYLTVGIQAKELAIETQHELRLQLAEAKKSAVESRSMMVTHYLRYSRVMDELQYLQQEKNMRQGSMRPRSDKE